MLLLVMITPGGFLTYQHFKYTVKFGFEMFLLVTYHVYRVILGGVSQYCVAHAPCAVTVVGEHNTI